jgi:hypothetical protein
MKHALVYLITARGVATASFVAATCATAMAQSGSPLVSSDAVTLVGTVSVRELSASAANRQTPQIQQNLQPIRSGHHAPLLGRHPCCEHVRSQYGRFPVA